MTWISHPHCLFFIVKRYGSRSALTQTAEFKRIVTIFLINSVLPMVPRQSHTHSYIYREPNERNRNVDEPVQAVHHNVRMPWEYLPFAGRLPEDFGGMLAIDPLACQCRRVYSGDVYHRSRTKGETRRFLFLAARTIPS